MNPNNGRSRDFNFSKIEKAQQIRKMIQRFKPTHGLNALNIGVSIFEKENA
jgi:hypothetical protein